MFKYSVCGSHSVPVHPPHTRIRRLAGSRLRPRGDGCVSLASCFLNKSLCEIYKTERSIVGSTDTPWTCWIQRELLAWRLIRFQDALRSNKPSSRTRWFRVLILCVLPWAAGRFGDKHTASESQNGLICFIIRP